MLNIISTNYSLQILVFNPQIQFSPSSQNFQPPPQILYSKTFEKSSCKKSQSLSKGLQTYWVIFDLMKSQLDIWDKKGENKQKTSKSLKLWFYSSLQFQETKHFLPWRYL